MLLTYFQCPIVIQYNEISCRHQGRRHKKTVTSRRFSEVAGTRHFHSAITGPDTLLRVGPQNLVITSSYSTAGNKFTSSDISNYSFARSYRIAITCMTTTPLCTRMNYRSLCSRTISSATKCTGLLSATRFDASTSPSDG